MPETLSGHIQTVAYGGDGITHHDNNTVFIPNTIAGEDIRYRITDKKRGVMRGKLDEISKPSPQRVSPPCAVSETCGGCALQHMHLSAQADLKTSWVLDAFKPFISDNTEFTPLQPHHSGFAGRRRVRWFVQNGKLGFRKRFSHDLTHTHHCNALSKGLDRLRHTLEALSIPASIQSIRATQLHNGTHIILESDQTCPDDFTVPHNPHQQWWWRKLDSPSIKALLKPTQTLFDRIALPDNQHIDIEIGANDFVQGHQQGNQMLIQQIIAWSQGSQRIVDLFSGCGNLSLPLAQALGAQVQGAELNPASVKAANSNAKRLKLDAHYQTMDLFGSFDLESFIGADTLILDPPRKGAKRICQHIRQLFPKQIIMVNCDLAAAKRDAKALFDAGFTLKALRPLDLFPYTGHVETLSLWVS